MPPLSKPRLLLPMLVILLLAGGGAYAFRHDIADLAQRATREPLPEETPIEAFPEQAAPNPEPASKPATDTPAVPAPQPKPAAPAAAASINLKMPFIVQAPFANWDEVHEETCEEASMLMVAAYLNGTKTISKEQAEKDLLAMVDYQNKTIGRFEDTSAEETAKIMRDYLKLPKAKAVAVKSNEDIKAYLRRGVPVIMPAAGKLLKNPNFKNGGPDYHMLVIKGYTEKGSFVANDPGTRNGENYIYSADTIWSSLDNWDQATLGLTGEKMVVVVE